MPADIENPLVDEMRLLVNTLRMTVYGGTENLKAYTTLMARLTELLAGEPVAWTALDKFKDWFITRNALMANEWSRLGHTVSPLYQSPAAATAALQARVAELEGVLGAVLKADTLGEMQLASAIANARAALNKEPRI